MDINDLWIWKPSPQFNMLQHKRCNEYLKGITETALKGYRAMTIDTSTIEAGDTVELRNGSRIVAEEHKWYSGEVSIELVDWTLDQWSKNGEWAEISKRIHPLDIVAIHKKPQDVKVVQYCAYGRSLSGGFQSFKDAKDSWGDNSSLKGYVKITLNLTTKKHEICEVE